MENIAGGRDIPTTLDLTFLASGMRQHAFVPTGEPDGWVYKIPAAFGYVLPYEHRIGSRGPVHSPRQAAHRVVVVWPHLLRTRVLGPAMARLEATPGLRVFAIPARLAARVARAVRDRLLMAYFRRARRRNFDDMLGLLDELHRENLDHVVLPYRILRDRRAVLRVGSDTRNYRGPILAQRQIDSFFSKKVLYVFDWDELISALHDLWRHGFALVEKGENLGYRSWALLDGHPRLADTSSLSRDRRRAISTLHSDILDAQERHVLSAQTDSERARSFERFFQHLRQSITQEQVATLWRSGIASVSDGSVEASGRRAAEPAKESTTDKDAGDATG